MPGLAVEQDFPHRQANSHRLVLTLAPASLASKPWQEPRPRLMLEQLVTGSLAMVRQY